jgi:hypothetical protein
MLTPLPNYVHTTNCQFDSFITKLHTAALPNYACILVDLVNCWNQISQEAGALNVIEPDPCLHTLVHYFDLMYDNPNLCFFHCPNGSIDSFTQEDGFPRATLFLLPMSGQ